MFILLQFLEAGQVVHHAVMQSKISEYYGAQATISVYGLPEVKPNHSSAAIIGLNYYDPDHSDELMNGLMAGWEDDNYDKTGCANLRCQGFVVQHDAPIIPGEVLTSLSAYNGEQKYITLAIHKVPEGDWWLYFGEGTELTAAVGYWPTNLFSGLANKATYIEWGGAVKYTEVFPGPPMGSGHYSGEGAYKAASFSNLHIIDKHNNIQIVEPGALNAFISREDCYSLSAGEQDGGLQFYFGGPEGCTQT